jgi:glucose/arabinose dehydrogenase
VVELPARPARRPGRRVETLARGLVVAGAVAVTGCGGAAGTPTAAGPAAAPTTIDGTLAAAADGPAARLRLEPLPARFHQPVGLVPLPGRPATVVVVERGGRLRLVTAGRPVGRPLLDVTDLISTGAEQGLLSVAFAPDYPSTGRAYVALTDRVGALQVLEYRRHRGDADRLDPVSRRPLLRVFKPFANHNGGQLLVDPAGLLLVGTGDGGGAGDPGERSQDLRGLLGKILRLDPRPAGPGRPYRIPPDNPYARTPGVLPEIYVSGLRNPWRFAVDHNTGGLVVGDVGQHEVEELTLLTPALLRRGPNLGWSVYEGDAVFAGNRELVGPGPVVPPGLVYRHRGGLCSITAGPVYTGRIEVLRGAYLYGDFCTGQVWAARPGRAATLRTSVRLPVRVDALTAFGEDGRGEVYLVDYAGTVSRLIGG